MNSPNDEELNKINRLRQKLYARSLTDNASKLNMLHKHNLDVPSSWEDKSDSIKESSPDKSSSPNKKETVADFLNNKFDNIHTDTDSFSEARANRIENRMEQTRGVLKIAEAELMGSNNQLYPNLKKGLNSIESSFQSDYHPDIKTVKIGETADMQGKDIKKKKNKNNITFSFVVFMFIFFFFVGAGFYAYINLIKGVNTVSTSKIDIKITGPSSVKSGEVSDFIIDITNNNSTDLVLSDLMVQYPDGSKSPIDRAIDLYNVRLSIGTIRSGETIRQKNSVVFFGELNAKKNVKYSYEFNIVDSSTIFKKEKDIGVFIAGSPINVVINNIKEINNNQELTFDIEINSNTEEVLKNIQLKVEYPFGYKLLESNPKPVADNNTWSFDSIDALSTTSIRIKGKFTGEINVDKNFRFILGVEDNKTKEMLTVLSTQDTLVAIRKPFVATRLLIDGDGMDVKSVTYDQNLKSDLIITNNLKEIITDVVVEVSVAGVLIDRMSVKSSDGFYDSNRDIILWDKSLNAGLTSIPPGESRELSFNIATIKSDDNLIKSLRRAVSDITINIKAGRMGTDRVTENVNASTKKQLRLKTDAFFNSNMGYSSGVFSPEVNKEVIYKYTGNISNTANTLKDVVFNAKLPPNAIWKNSYVSNVTINPASVRYNKSTREISINLSDIEAGAGIDKVLREFSFLIGFIPTLTQTGQYPIVIMNPTITATDSFTGERIQIKNESLNTSVTIGDKTDVSGMVK
jgi:hypothetical protein